jgi:cytosine/adenosine deaminase-related metal-dependent hydrolase
MDGPPIRNGRVGVEDGQVSWVGRSDDPEAEEGPFRDLGAGVLLPGLVNAHCHLELSPLAGQIPCGGGLVPRVEAVVAARGRAGQDAVGVRAEAIRSLEERGTVAVGDMSNTLGHLDQLAASRLRSVVFLELLAWDPARAEASANWAAERLAAAQRTPASNVEVRLAAHAPHSVSPELLACLVGRGGVASIHLAESPDEVRFLAQGDGPWADFLERRGLGHVAFRPPGTSPVEYVDGLGLLHSSLVAAHAVQVDAEDRARLARRGVSVALCPRSNRNLGVGRADVPALLAAGVRLCLGTDSLASVETLDVLDDAVLLTQQFPTLDPAAVLRMATADGAAALGLDDLGTIAPGKRAALAFAEAASPPADPHAHVLSGSARLRRVEVE